MKRSSEIAFVWNVPNAMSLLRLALIPAFTVLYLCKQDPWAFAALFLSGMTDCLDGYFARKLNQVTECGKLLDPLADKLTQFMVVVCLTTRYKEILPLALICFVKELLQGIGGLILLRHHNVVRGAKWFGKVSTVLFYACMLALVLWRDIMLTIPWVLILVVSVAGLSMVGAFFGYLTIYIKLLRQSKREKTPSDEGSHSV